MTDLLQKPESNDKIILFLSAQRTSAKIGHIPKLTANPSKFQMTENRFSDQSGTGFINETDNQ